MEIYLVGGAVRDRLLGHPFHERDWVVVGSTPQAMIDAGYKTVGKDFPVFLHPDTGEEYALARTERKTAPGYTGFHFHCDTHVTLEDDLRRRDLTINAIAQASDGTIIDPYSGQQDLNNKILRHVSDAFIEDPVRILRIARFAARYAHLGFTIAPETMTLMQSMVNTGEVDHLVAERVWKEMGRALSEARADVFFTSLRDCGALARIMPELDTLFGIPQPPKHHPEIDTGIHSLMVLQQACRLSNSTLVRFGALLHDLGKGTTDPEILPSHHGHEERGVSLVKTLCQRLSIPNDYKQLALLVTQYHTHCHRARHLSESSLVKLFKSVDALRKPERFEQFLLCCEADARGRTGFEDTYYPQAEYLRQALRRCQEVNIQDIVQAGYEGKQIAEELHRRQVNHLKPFRAEHGAH